MIASLRGTVVALDSQQAIIECHGVGYQVIAPTTTLAQFQRGAEIFVLVSAVIREDSHTLYAFLDQEDKDMFAVLQTVSGVGPRLALAVQSLLSVSEIAQAISTGDAKTLQRVPGVGKRAAERMIVDLKEKISSFHAAQSDDTMSTVGSQEVMDISSDTFNHVVEALIGLGFAEKTVQPIVASIMQAQPDLAMSAVLKASLSALNEQK
ncbi:Holliday junction branch migration protein RuvA [Corynebacterium sp. sy017]|uniref:Holliday junction branch migration protein RuvA n=1 Tax=unclassified Corynebacterium TaxID=2624378 RepID=UPI001184FF3B|nr:MULTISPECIES: Holliday junction branch migration protein RuvA [unclassified Corynebacterium]MBP3087722.1 Holliday junction branch migration protein RuvA [Corynebacterium sp. sy017]TSD92276.1 Holliday junction branch migration protein RuvA [Corynebacterium sp. SY003]